MPFALLYGVAPQKRSASLAAGCGVPRGNKAAPGTVALDLASVWPFAEVARTRRTCLVTDLAAVKDELPVARGRYPVTQAVAVPLMPSGETGMSGILVVGLDRVEKWLA